MKDISRKMLRLFIALFIVSCVHSLCGCSDKAIKDIEIPGMKVDHIAPTFGGLINHGDGIYTTVVNIEGHDYIIFSGYKCGNIIHAESCSCKKGL